MNDYEIEAAQDRYAQHPVLGPATQTLTNLMEWTNAHSDGWPYWPKPARAAAQLMQLIMGSGAWHYFGSDWYATERPDATPAAYRQALRSIRAFRTRQGADFTIVELAVMPTAAR